MACDAHSALSVITEALSTYDAAIAQCPVNQGKVAYKAECPRCHATAGQNCGLNASASYHFVQAVRGATPPLSPSRSEGAL